MNEANRVDATSALVLLSGGQDSTTCLYWALQQFGSHQVSAITFDYGQRHRIELECAQHIAQLAGVPQVVLPINTFTALGGNALTDAQITITKTSDANTQSPNTQLPNTQLPNTFVPGRNLIFLTFAAAYAYLHGISHLVGGMAQTDYSGYPDCRQQTLQALEQAIQLGMDYPITLHTPLMFKSKRETVELARELGAFAALAYSHTCYEGRQPPCGVCPACLLRAKGFLDAGVADPLIERFR